MKRRLIFGVLFFILAAGQAFSQSSWDAYTPNTLKKITTTIAEKSLKNPDVVITAPKNEFTIIFFYNPVRARVKAIYTGSSRKISGQRLEVIKAWLKTLGKPKDYLDLFEDEYLFTEDGIEYWLPTQKQVAAYFPDELKKGDTVTLLVAWLGVRKESEKLDHIFVMNEFEAEESP